MKSPINSFSLVLGFWLDIFLGGGSLLGMVGQKKGFTLVELAIALVIIGLLIGGILAAQSMITTAKVNSTAMQIGQFDAMVENFKTKYNYLPGDAPAFGGNGDGLVDGSGGNVMAFCGEVQNFWSNIDSQQYIASPTACTFFNPNYKASSTGANKNVPASKIGKSGSFVYASALAPAAGGNTTDLTVIKNYYIIMDASQFQTTGAFYYGTTTTSANSAVRPVDLLALDTKIDDGIGTTGNVLSGGIDNVGGGLGAPWATALTTCSSAAGVYNLTYATYECTPLIRIGAYAGDPQ